MTNCGPGASGTESCCISLEVTGGTYYRTYDGVAAFDSFGEAPPVPDVAADGGPTDESDPATVSSFRLDKYLVTVGRFRQFVNAALPGDGGAGWLPAPGSGRHTYLNGGLGLVNVGADGGVAYEQGWIASYDSLITPPGHAFTWTTSAGSQENLPISGVTWLDAYAFCIWDGGFLPSEAEWEYAAAGGPQQREYPWGSTDPGTGNQYAIYGYGAPVNGNATGCYYPDVTTCAAGTPVNIAPVGTATLGAGLWGQLDLAGDMFEWVLDSYDTYVNPCVDCANMTGKGRGDGVYEPVFRGGSYATSTYYLLAPLRYEGSPPIGFPWGINGFRCARSP